MPTDALKTTVTELPDSRVRVQVQVPPGEVSAHVERKAREIGREMKMPGFRRGKVPAPLVIQRVGRETVLEEAVRDTLGSWYSEAIDSAGIVPVGDPKLDLADLPEEGGALEFSIEIGVLPKATLGEFKGLEVGKGEPTVEDEVVSRELEGLRERMARLETVERAAAAGDFVVVDYLGSIDGEPFQGGEGRDQLVELGSGNLIPGFEEGLAGAAAGETRTVELTFPGDYPNEQLAGREASFEIGVKEVKLKVLPELNEDFAADVGFDSLRELREDIAERLREADSRRVESEFREAALDAAVANARVETPDALVQAKAEELWERMLHSLSHRGITREAYLKISGRDEQELVSEMLPEAAQSLRREATIAAIVEAEEIVPSEQDLIDALTPTAEREEVEPQALLERLRQSGRAQGLAEDLAARQAVELVAEQAKPIPLDRAKAREQLWTPEAGGDAVSEAASEGAPASAPAGADKPARIWTPGR